MVELPQDKYFVSLLCENPNETTHLKLSKKQRDTLQFYFQIYEDLSKIYDKDTSYGILFRALTKQLQRNPKKRKELQNFFLDRDSGKNLLVEIFHQLDDVLKYTPGTLGEFYKFVVGGIKVYDLKPYNFVSFNNTFMKMIHQVISMYREVAGMFPLDITTELFINVITHYKDDTSVCDFTQDDLTKIKKILSKKLDTVLLDGFVKYVKDSRQDWAMNLSYIDRNLATLRGYIRSGMKSYPCSHIKLTNLLDLMLLLRMQPDGKFAKDFYKNHDSRFFWRVYVDFLFRTICHTSIFGIPDVVQLKTQYASKEKCEVFSTDVTKKENFLRDNYNFIKKLPVDVKMLDFIKRQFSTFLKSHSLSDVKVASYSEMIFSALENYFGKNLSELDMEEIVSLYDILMNANCVAQNDFSILRELAITPERQSAVEPIEIFKY